MMPSSPARKDDPLPQRATHLFIAGASGKCAVCGKTASGGPHLRT